MAWTYDPTNLGTATLAEQLDSVRFLVGDTDTNDQQVQDEVIAFALEQFNGNIYSSAAFVARGIAAKYSRLVDTDLDGQLAESYSQLQKHYKDLAKELEMQSLTNSAGLGFSAGGINVSEMYTARLDPNRNQPRIRRDQFRYEDNDYTGDY